MSCCADALSWLTNLTRESWLSYPWLKRTVKTFSPNLLVLATWWVPAKMGLSGPISPRHGTKLMAELIKSTL